MVLVQSVSNQGGIMEEIVELVEKATPYVLLYSLFIISTILNFLNWVSYNVAVWMNFLLFSCRNIIPNSVETFDFDDIFNIDVFLSENFESFDEYVLSLSKTDSPEEIEVHQDEQTVEEQSLNESDLSETLSEETKEDLEIPNDTSISIEALWNADYGD